jgi:hypothetical protein
MVKKKAGIPPAEAVNLIGYPPRRSIFDMLLQQQSSDPDAQVEARLAKFVGVKTNGIRPWLHGGMLEVLPFRLEWK